MKKSLFLANLSGREKSLFYFTLAAIAVSLIYKFAFKPVEAVWSGLNSQIIEKEIELKRNLKFLAQKDSVEDVYNEISGYARRIGSDEEEIAFLLNKVEREARGAKIRIANIRPKPFKEFPFYKKYVLEMNCVASMENYVEFIYNLQRSTQLIRVEKLKLLSQGKDNSLLKAQVRITRVVATE